MMRRSLCFSLFIIIILIISACSQRKAVSVPQQGDAPAILVTQTPMQQSTATSIPTLLSPSPTIEPSPALPPDPFRGLRINDLAARTYGGPGIILGTEIQAGDGFRRWEMSYTSDGLRIT